MVPQVLTPRTCMLVYTVNGIFADEIKDPEMKRLPWIINMQSLPTVITDYFIRGRKEEGREKCGNRRRQTDGESGRC